MQRYLVAFLLMMASAGGAAAQSGQPVVPLVAGKAVSSTNPMPVTGSFSATLSGFRPTAYGTPITATTGGATGSLPAGTQVVATNVGTTYGAYCKLGASTSTTGQYIAPNGGWFGFAISGETQLSCQGSGGTTTINMAGGSGLATGTGGGGNGGAVTIADGADVAQGAVADAASSAGGTGTVSAKLRLATSLLNSIVSQTAGIAQGTTTSGLTGSLVFCNNTTTAAGGSNGTSNAINCDTNGNLRATIDALTGSKSAGTAAASSALTGAIYNSTPPTLTDGQQAAMQFGPRGSLVTAISPAWGAVAPASAAISQASSSTLEILALTASKKIYVTSFNIMAAGTVNVTFKYGTGTNCGTGTTVLTGAYPLTAQAGVAIGSGTGAVLVVPAGNALCLTADAATQVSGSFTYQIF